MSQPNGRAPDPSAERPIGWFVHHQGRGHASRTIDLLRALPTRRPVTVFCASPELFADTPGNVTVERIPSLFEADGREAHIDTVPQPATVHCAPLGWPGIREAMGAMAAWMRATDPVLFVTDVSAEVAQLARLLSVPHVVALQHGCRNDPGHRAALDGAAGVLAPFHSSLAQPDWDASWLSRTHFAPGLGVGGALPDVEAARRNVGLRDGERAVVVVSGAGGHGFRSAPLGVGARALPDHRWLVIGEVASDWHGTANPNLEILGWVDNPEDYIVAADLVVASTGNTTCTTVLRARKPWIAIPEWRYFDEQVEKAQSLARANLAHAISHAPSSAAAWRHAATQAYEIHDPEAQAAAGGCDAAPAAAAWLENLIANLWRDYTPTSRPTHNLTL